MINLTIKEIIGDEWIASREAGSLVREAILSYWSEDVELTLDFQGLTVASVSFFDEVFRLLVLDISLKEIKEHLFVQNMSKQDYALMMKIISSRLTQEVADLIGQK